jgi:hypothetical protein
MFKFEIGRSKKTEVRIFLSKFNFEANRLVLQMLLKAITMQFLRFYVIAIPKQMLAV